MKVEIKTLKQCMQYLSVFVLITLGGGNIAYAQMEADIPDILQCTRAVAEMEKEYQIPAYILHAISMTETGKQSKINDTSYFAPWPWTANIEGQGVYFATQQEAVEAIETALSQGKKSIDVGCMQINLKFHKDAFETLDDAFDPEYNVRYASEFLRSLYERYKDWPKAVERYHSATPKYYKKYRKLVSKNWDRAEELLRPNQGRLAMALADYDHKNIASSYGQNDFKIRRMQHVAQLRAKVRSQIKN
ncbi:MAG: lytic transglycosylase domain-containing protein [Pseudomonadota bacterium]